MIDQRYFSFNKQTDWDQGKAYNLNKSDHTLKINQLEKYGLTKTLRFSETDMLGRIKDFSIGSDHNLYLLDDQRNIWMYDWMNQYQELIFSSEAQVCTAWTKIASIQQTLFLIDAFAENRVAAYSVINGQMKWSLNEWKNRPLLPLAVHTDTQHLFILVPLFFDSTELGTLLPKGTRMAVLKIQDSGQVVHVYEHTDLLIEKQTSYKEALRSFILSVSPAGALYVLNQNTRELFQFSAEGQVVFRASICRQIKPLSLAIDGKNQIFVGEDRKISIKGEDDRFLLKISPEISFQSKVMALRGYVRKLLLDADERMFALDSEINEIRVLELYLRTNELSGVGDLSGVIFLTGLDSTEEETEWHKILLTAGIPEETQIKISYFTSDRKQFLISGQYLDLDDYIRSDHISLQEKLTVLQPIWLDTLVNPKDALLFKGKGRYLWLQIELIGSEFRTPVIQKLRVYFPKSTYINHLPEVYQENQKSKDFLERFLALFHTFYSEIEEEINHISRYFDVDVVSGPYLKWLSTWLGVSNAERWSEQQLKQLLKIAPRLYQLRGTKQAIEMIVVLYTGQTPMIVEYFQYKHMRKNVELREIMDQLYGSNPYTFTVIVDQASIKSERERVVLEKILEEEKPAFTEVKLVVLERSIYLDMYSYLGMNTYLTEPSLMVLDAHSSVPQQTLLIDINLDNRLDSHTRLGLDSELE